MEERIPQPNDLIQLEAPAVAEDSSDEGEGEIEFEFPFVSRDSPAGTAATADELFADGRIRPCFYPVFGRGGGGGGCVHGGAAPRPAPAAAEPRVRGRLGRLFLEESLARDSSSASSTASTSSSSAATDDDGGGLDGAAPESYCVWRPGGVSASAAPAPRPPRKSGSTGSMARWRRISDLVVRRSHSDGKEKFVFFAAAPTTSPDDGSSKKSDRPRPRPAPPAAAGGRKPPHAATAEVDAGHRLAYLGSRGGTPRRTFLPYREELVGFFASVNGVSRSHQHPFPF